MFRSILAILIVLLIIVVAAVVQAQSNFTEQPQSARQAEGLETVFECLYPGAISYAWAINGTFLSDYPPGIVTDSPSGGSPATLTIPAIPEYNNTVIQCRAIVVVGGDIQLPLSDNATLTVYETDIDQTTFTVHPASVTQVEGMNVVFECLYPNATAYGWAFNGTSQSVFPPDIVDRSPSGDSPATLTIPAIPEYNNTVVHCEAVGVLSESATLKVQGPLESASNLRFVNGASCDSISIAWEAPFSLNLTNAELDVLYYVDVYNITGGEEVMVESVNIPDQYYTFSHANLSLNHEFKFTVTPVSNVPGAVNGTNSEHLQHRLGAPIQISSDHVRIKTGLKKCDLDLDLSLDPIRVVFPMDAVATCEEHMPDKYSVQVKFTDTVRNDSVNCSTVYELKNNAVELTVIKDINCNISRHQLCNITVIAENDIGSSRSYPEMEASTHDVQNVTADSSNPGQLDIRCSYLNGSIDEGFFTIVYSSSNRSDITYRVAARIGLEPTTNLSIGNLQQDEYKFVVYDLPDSMMPEEKPATEWMQTVIEIAKDSQQNNSDTIVPVPDTLLPWSPEVTSPGDGMVFISCSFSDPRTTGCVGVIHSVDLVNLTLTILPVNRTDKNQHHNSNCTTGVPTGDYSVVVFGQLVDRLETSPAVVTLITVMSTPTTQDPPLTTTFDSTSDSAGQVLGAAVGGTLAALALSLIILLIIVLIGIVMVLVCGRKSKTGPSVESAQMTSVPPSSRYEDAPLLTKSAPHYETVELPDRPPPDYETVVLPNGNRQETSTSIDDDAPPVPPPCKPEDIIQLIQHGSVSFFSMAVVEERQIQPESHDSHMEGYVVPEPAYDVAKRVMVKDATNTGPLLDSTTTEHQYSEIGGSINKEGIHYIHVNPKPKPEGLPDQPVDPTAVVYSEVKKEKLAPKSEESEQPPQTKTATPTPPPPPTAESLLSIIHLIAGKWEEFGEALEIDEDRLDDFSNEAHDQVRLHDMVHYYFSNVRVKHTWEEFVEALRKIGEYECADRIVREKRLEDQLNSEPDSSPPVPPRGLSTSQATEFELETESIVVGPTKTHVRNGSVGETQTIGNSSFIPGNEESNINNNSDSESYSSQATFPPTETESSTLPSDRDSGIGKYPWSTPRSSDSSMDTESDHDANNRAASPQPGQESQDYTQTATDEDTERDGPVLLSPLVNGMVDIHKYCTGSGGPDDHHYHDQPLTVSDRLESSVHEEEFGPETYYNAMLLNLGVLRQLDVSLRRKNRAFVLLNSEQGKSREDAVQTMMRDLDQADRCEENIDYSRPQPESASGQGQDTELVVNDNFVKQTQAPKEKSNNQICVLLQSWIHALDAPVHQVKYTFDLIHMAFTMWRKNNFSTGMLMDTYEDRGGTQDVVLKPVVKHEDCHGFLQLLKHGCLWLIKVPGA